MASPVDSADEGEIVEAPPQPRSEQGGDVDRSGRHRGRFSQTPEDDARSRHSGDGYTRRSRSPRGWKRSRDDRDRDREPRDSHDRRDPRHFRVHYEQSPRDDRRHYRDLDRPVSRGSHRAGDDRSHSYSGRRDDRPSASHRSETRNRDDYDRGANGYPDKRPRHRSRSPRDRHDRGNRDRGRYGSENKYSAHAESHPREDPVSKRAAPADAPNSRKQEAKRDQGATVERGINGLAISQPRCVSIPYPDWDPSSAMDEEAAQEAEIQRRRRAREAALKRAAAANGAVAPLIQALQNAETHSTPGSTRQTTPAPQKTDVNTPNSNNPSTPALSPSHLQDAMSPTALNFIDDQDLVKANGVKANDADGPSAADYDPTADMREDERRDELRFGNVGLHGEARRPSQVAAPEAVPEKPAPPSKEADEDEDFDMFAEDFDDNLAPAPSKVVPAHDGVVPLAVAGGGGNVDGDDKDGYYKIRPGEILDGRYQLSTALGRGMFSGVARATNLTTKETVAIKIMRNNDALRKGGYTEIAILQKLNAADPENKKHLIKFERSFEDKGHLCMVFENLSLNLREVLKKFGNNVGINLNATRAYAYQIFLALGHMRKCSIIHADLKPDNILVNEARNLLKICDLGTAIDRSDAATASTEITPYLVSRFYRAPEIILGLPYDYAVDMWSIGCTLYELYTGKILFTGDSNNQMLKNIMEIRGKLSQKLYRRGQLAGLHFDEQGNFLSVERDKVYGKTTVRTLAVVKPTRDLRTRLLAASSDLSDAETRELNHFVDLLERCLTLNPDKRLTPSEALRHPFFTHRVQLSSRH
ncbi:kinase-like domain-containing protein [Immersiella caudata]|uniref:non-specific serine/threonine protein kinase n=1 Tax=Immersiella caudata TaxID=314043 RepID=A0AA39WSY4_9PEZI|nr:kinase-like domain-containing protein [Immersiella caudata]